jgi:hypothetical protein
MNENLRTKEIDNLIQRITNRMAHCCFVGMTWKHHDFVVQATNDLQVISNLLSRSMPLRRTEWENKYV